MGCGDSSTITYVYSDFYCLGTFATGAILAVPTGCGIFSSMIGVCVAKMTTMDRILRRGMLVGLLAPVALVLSGYYWQLGWWTTTAGVAVMSATGFFVLPAMQVLMLEDFKHMYVQHTKQNNLARSKQPGLRCERCFGGAGAA